MDQVVVKGFGTTNSHHDTTSKICGFLDIDWSISLIAYSVDPHVAILHFKKKPGLFFTERKHLPTISVSIGRADLTTANMLGCVAVQVVVVE